MALPSPSRDRGFTLIELLVVVGILALLATILLVVGAKAFKSADATRLAAQLQTIEKALDAYKTDFGSFPVTSLDTATTAADDQINQAGYRGARVLCKALVAPGPQGRFNAAGSPTKFNFNLPNQDGKDGPGFRVPPRSGDFRASGSTLADGNPEVAGQVYGPYLAGNAISYGTPTGGTGVAVDSKAGTSDDTAVIADANGNIILYYPVINAQPPTSGANADDLYFGNGAAGTLPMFRQSDNSTWYPDALTPVMRESLKKAGSPKGPYLLVSAGRDGLFGPNPGDKNKANDDVTNFGQ